LRPRIISMHFVHSSITSTLPSGEADPCAAGDHRDARRIYRDTGRSHLRTGLSPESLAAVVGVLVEVPLTLSVACIVNRSKNWYEAPAAS